MSDRDLSALRREYALGGLDESDLDADPVAMFRRWLVDATTAGLHEPNAMVVSTVSAEGRPSSRIVLLKGLDERGFVFYTNYSSRKAGELDANPFCALLFPWHGVERQVRVEGRVSRLTGSENATYFATRPRDSQLGAWASPQSTVVPDRAALDRRYAETVDRFAGAEVPVPEHWGGFRIAPELVEFWQGRRGRMHDRLRYRRSGSGSGTGAGSGSGSSSGAGSGSGDAAEAGWVVERLAP